MKRIIKKIKIFMDKQKKCKPSLFEVCMTNFEKELFLKHVKSAKNYLEFGAGGSTFLVLINTKAKVTSVESDNDYLNLMRGWYLIRKSEENKRLSLNYINIGKTVAWGVPESDKNKELFPNYSFEIFNHVDKNNIDTVFIDGRFRVACVLSTLLNCNKNTKIIIHDFRNREYYHAVLEFLDIVEETQTMCVFSIKNDINIEKIKVMYLKYKYIFD